MIRVCRPKHRIFGALVLCSVGCVLIACATAPEPRPPEPLLAEFRTPPYPPSTLMADCLAGALATQSPPGQPSPQQEQAVSGVEMIAYSTWYDATSQDDKERAYAVIERCLEIAPGYRPCVAILAIMQMDDRDLVQAAESLRLAIRIAPDAEDNFALCTFLADVDAKLAQQALAEPLPVRPPTPEWVRDCLGRIRTEYGSAWGAPLSPEDVRNLGLAESERLRALWVELSRRGATTEPAHVLVQRCLHIYPSSIPCLQLRAEMQHAEGHLADTAATLRQLIRIAPSYELSRSPCQLLLEIESKLDLNSIPAHVVKSAEPNVSDPAHHELGDNPVE